MTRGLRRFTGLAVTAAFCSIALIAQSKIGDEHAVTRHLTGGAEHTLALPELIALGRDLFAANWTDQDGAGRPFTKGNGAALLDRARPLNDLRTFNRMSGPDANSCTGCHRAPFNAPGGGGDVVSVVLQGAERFDFLTFDRSDAKPTRGSVDEMNRQVTLKTVGNPRVPPDLLGSGYIEMLARQMTEDLRRIRDSIRPGESKPLTTKGVAFGRLTRRQNGGWDTRAVQGLPPQSLLYSAASPPSLIVRPWRQSGTAVSLREFTNTSYNQHLGIQTTERFGIDVDPDNDGVANEMTVGDVTAVAMFEATLQVPGRVIPNDRVIESAISEGEKTFGSVGCTACHTPSLPLERDGWIYSEPGPFNPAGNLRRSQARTVNVDLMSAVLPQPRLTPRDSLKTLDVPLYSDLKLHDITDRDDATAQEPLDLNRPTGSTKFFDGNRKFLTRRLWGVGNQATYWHDGRFTTMRQATMAHAGEALESRREFERVSKQQQDDVIAFLKSLQALPPGTKALVVDERFQPKSREADRLQ